MSSFSKSQSIKSNLFKKTLAHSLAVQILILEMKMTLFKNLYIIDNNALYSLIKSEIAKIKLRISMKNNSGGDCIS